MRERMRSRLLFYNLDVAKTSPPRVLADADRTRGGAAWFPSSNGEDGGLSSRQCSVQFRPGTPVFQLAVAQRPARVVRDDEIAGSTPAGETNRFPSSSVDQRARGYDPRGRGFESLPGCQYRAPYIRRKSPRLSSGSARVQVPPAPPIFHAARSSTAQSSRLLTGRLQVQLLPRRPFHARLAQSAERPPYKREADGSIPSPRTNTASQADLVTAPA